LVEGTIAAVGSTIDLKNCRLFLGADGPEPEDAGASNPTAPKSGDTPTEGPTAVSQPTTSPAVAGPTSKVGPDEIMMYLRSLPPLQVEEAGNRYQGTEVEWTVLFADVLSLSDGTKSLHAREPQGFGSVFCPIDLAQYPQLENMAKYEQITVHGTIVSAGVDSIELDDCRLLFQR